MLLTIVTAAFRLSGVERVIESLKKQTNQNWFHILVNDNSEEIRPMLKKWSEEDPRRLWIDVGTRLGYYGAFSRSIGVMASFNHLPEGIRKRDNDEWICFIDDDNDLESYAIEEFKKTHEEHPEAVMIGAQKWEVRGKINKDYKHILENKIYPQNTDLSAWFYKKEVFEKCGYFPASLRFKITYDWELIRRIKEYYGEDKFYIVPNTKWLIFYHKER